MPDRSVEPPFESRCDIWGADETWEQMEAGIIERLPTLMRARTCQAGKPWTGDNPDAEHGHTDCYLYRLAANEIERLRGERA